MRPTTHNIRAKLALHDKIHPQNVQNPRAINLRGRTGAISHPTHQRIRAKHGTGKPVRLILEPRVELLKLKLAARLGESAGEPRIQGGTGGQELELEIHLADWNRRVAGAERIRLAASGRLGRCAACEEGFGGGAEGKG